MNRNNNNSSNEQQNNNNGHNVEQQADRGRENNRIHLQMSGVYGPAQGCYTVKFGCSVEGIENNAEQSSCCNIF